LDLLNKPRASTQLYLTTIVVDDATGSVTSYLAVYIWNQNRFAASGTPSAYAAITLVWGTTMATVLSPQCLYRAAFVPIQLGHKLSKAEPSSSSIAARHGASQESPNMGPYGRSVSPPVPSVRSCLHRDPE